MTRRLLRPAGWLALVAVLVVVPLVNSPYQVERFTSSIVLAVAVLGLVVLTGWSGQISLGHGALFGVGAYTSALLVAKAGWPHLMTMLVAALAGFVCGAIAGLPALRVSGVYLALVSLTMATVFPTVIQHFASVTGGTQGMAVPAFEPPVDGLAPDQWGYYLALAVAVPLFLLVSNLGRSRIGAALRAARDSEPAAVAIGVPVARYKIVAFAVSGALTATAGSLFVLVQPFPYLDSRSFTIALSISLLTGLVVGGARSVVGAALAGLFLDRVPALVEDGLHLDGSATNVFYGGLLILLMFVLPTGIVGAFSARRGRIPRPPRLPHPAEPDRGTRSPEGQPCTLEEQRRGPERVLPSR